MFKKVWGFILNLLAIVVVALLAFHFLPSALKKAIEDMIPDVNISLPHFSEEILPPEARVKEVRWVKFTPTNVTPDAYVAAEVSGITATRETERWGPNPVSKAKLKVGQSISVDMLIGYDPSTGVGSPFYTRESGGVTTLQINPDRLMAIQPRAIPFVNADKITCDDDRFKQGIMSSGQCGFLTSRFGDIAVVATQSCLPPAWEPIRQTIIQAEKQRMNALYKQFKRLQPDVTWKKPKLKVIFSPSRPSAWDVLPSGWTKGNDGERPILKQTSANGKDNFTIYTDQLKCTVDQQALKNNLSPVPKSLS